MLEKLIAITTRQGYSSGLPTNLPRLTIRSTAAPTPPTPAMFEPRFYFLLQGAKRMSGRAGTCAMASVGLPFVSEVVEASPSLPYLSVESKLDAGIVASLLLDMSYRTPAHREPGAISITQADESTVAPLERLMGLVDRPSEAAILAAQFERELCYRLMLGPLGSRLGQIGGRTSRFGQIRMAAEWISANANKPMIVEWLASHVGMSVTSFHRHFKAVTAHSPLVYQRKIRLLGARRQHASGGANVTRIAFGPGYVSPFYRNAPVGCSVPPVGRRTGGLIGRPTTARHAPPRCWASHGRHGATLPRARTRRVCGNPTIRAQIPGIVHPRLTHAGSSIVRPCCCGRPSADTPRPVPLACKSAPRSARGRSASASAMPAG